VPLPLTSICVPQRNDPCPAISIQTSPYERRKSGQSVRISEVVY
jgi:hypothetical protein